MTKQPKAVIKTQLSPKTSFGMFRWNGRFVVAFHDSRCMFQQGRYFRSPMKAVVDYRRRKTEMISKAA